MPRPPRPSFPSAPSEPGLRRLGVGGGSGGDRPIRAQLVIALVAVLVLLAVPLYLLRRPSPEDAGADPSPSASAFAPTVPVETEEKHPFDERLKLAEPLRVKCASSARASGQRGALCDQLPFFEGALAAAIRQTVDCAPRTGKTGTLNYVLRVDFDKKDIHVFPGASGSWKGPQARRAAQCVRQALAPAKWETMPHQYRYYEIAILSTYEPPSPTSAPMFE